MSFTLQEQNFVSDMMTTSADALALLDRINSLSARYYNNLFGSSLSDADLATLGSTSHLTLEKIGNALTAMTAIKTALGDTTTGQQVNLILMKG
jgi:hypothetical protein